MCFSDPRYTVRFVLVVSCSAGLFSRKRFTLYEERKEILLAVGQPNSFEFRRSDMEKNAKVCSLSLLYCADDSSR